MDYRVTAPAAAHCTLQLPASKSISNRALIINALAYGQVSPSPLAQCDDVNAMRHALSSESRHINVGPAGTAMRFLTAFFAAHDGRTVVLDGDERMRHRPIGVLVDALRHMGAGIDYVGQEGFPPLHITGRRLAGGTVDIDGSVSSQFISALLMIAPVAGGMTLNIKGELVSRPYVDMTMALMRHYGVDAQWRGMTIVVPAGNYLATPLTIEADWSAAAHWLALQALMPQSMITLTGLSAHSVQGDSAIVEMMAPLGVKAAWADAHSLRLLPASSTTPLPNGVQEKACDCFERDMSATPDLVPVLATTLCLLRVPFELTGLSTLRIKESDRVAALVTQLAKLGYRLASDECSMSYDGNHIATGDGVVLDAMGDHRMAMALALTATCHSSIVIHNGEVVTKSYPLYWDHLAQAGFVVDT